MATTEDIVLGAIGVVASILYAAVGTIVLKRDVKGDAKLAIRAYAAWWYGLAAIGVYALFARFTFNPADAGLGVMLGVLYIIIGVIYVAIGGLLYYLLYVYTGKNTWLGWVVAFYILMSIWLVALVEIQDPYIGPEEACEGQPDCDLTLRYHSDLPPRHPASLGFSLALVLPPIAAALAYFLLYFRVEHPEQKYRILLVSGGIVIWFSFSLFSTLGRAASGEVEASFTNQVISALLGVVAASMAFVAFRPPAFLRARWDAQEQA